MLVNLLAAHRDQLTRPPTACDGSRLRFLDAPGPAPLGHLRRRRGNGDRPKSSRSRALQAHRRHRRDPPWIGDHPASGEDDRQRDQRAYQPEPTRRHGPLSGDARSRFARSATPDSVRSCRGFGSSQAKEPTGPEGFGPSARLYSPGGCLPDPERRTAVSAIGQSP